MSKVLLKINNLTEKIYFIFYQTTIVFALFFYAVLKLVSGHKFMITNEEKVYSAILFIAFILSGFYKQSVKFSEKVNKVILYLFLFFAIFTFGMALYFLYFSITFEYGFWENPIIISITGFIMPILFIWFNYFLIIKNLKKAILKTDFWLGFQFLLKSKV